MRMTERQRDQRTVTELLLLSDFGRLAPARVRELVAAAPPVLGSVPTTGLDTSAPSRLRSAE